MASTTFTFGGLTAEFNTKDWGDLERYEDATAALEAANSEYEAIERDSARLKMLADAIRTFFDTLFGENSAVLAFGETRDIEVYVDGLSAVKSFVAVQADEYTEKAKGYLPRNAK